MANHILRIEIPSLDRMQEFYIIDLVLMLQDNDMTLIPQMTDWESSELRLALLKIHEGLQICMRLL